jgi:hypothetical protein
MTGKYTAPKTIPHAFGFRPGIDLDKLNQLAANSKPRPMQRASGPGFGKQRLQTPTGFRPASDARE